jgi:hypothetical protein
VETRPARSQDVHERGGFIIRKPGRHAFLARSPKGIVADFTHIDAFAPFELEVWRAEQRVVSVDLLAGELSDLAVVAVDDLGLGLAGALSYTWTSSDESILTVEPAGSFGAGSGVELNDDEVTIAAIAEGSATLTVARGELSKAIEVTVTAGSTQ